MESMSNNSAGNVPDSTSSFHIKTEKKMASTIVTKAWGEQHHPSGQNNILQQILQTGGGREVKTRLRCCIMG